MRQSLSHVGIFVTKRKRTIAILALPFAATIWLIGWVFSFVDLRKQPAKTKKLASQIRGSITLRNLPIPEKTN